MKQVGWTLLLLFLLTVVGTAWFWRVESWSFVDSLYMTIITLSTVGFTEVQPLGPRAKVFVVLFLVCGLGITLFGVVQIGEMIVHAELRDWLRRRGMNTAIKSLQDHFIVCGFGRMGRTICQHLADRKLPFVAIDRDEILIRECEERGWLFLCDDATDDRALEGSGIQRARGLAAVLDDEADNLYVVLSSRLLAPDLQIIARALDDAGARKMTKAGANRVVSLYASGAATMAQLLINPQVEDFFEFVSSDGTGLDLAEIRVSQDSSYVGKRLSETDFRDRGLIIVAIRRPHGEVVLPPSASTTILADDELIAFGRVAEVSRFLAGE